MGEEDRVLRTPGSSASPESSPILSLWSRRSGLCEAVPSLARQEMRRMIAHRREVGRIPTHLSQDELPQLDGMKEQIRNQRYSCIFTPARYAEVCICEKKKEKKKKRK